MKNLFVMIFFFVFFVVGNYVLSCTIVILSNGQMVLFGNNEDYNEPITQMWFYPAGNGKYGRVCFGHNRYYMFAQGGMNDQGLCIDANGLSSTGWRSDPAKPTITSIMQYLLSYSATVEDAINIFKQYNVPELGIAKFPVADAQGNMVIVEWGQGKIQFLKRIGRYQISTNFIQSNYSNPTDYPCWRYKAADRILSATDEVSVDLVKSALSATHVEGTYQTLYSNIYDLKKRVVYLYYLHNFNNVRIIKLDDELKKGFKLYNIPTIFQSESDFGDNQKMDYPEKLRLLQNYPNPFNPSTIIKFEIPKTSHSRLDIFNALGNSVKTLMNEVKEQGYYSITWNGTDDDGNRVSSGIYFYRLKSNNIIRMNKAIIMK